MCIYAYIHVYIMYIYIYTYVYINIYVYIAGDIDLLPQGGDEPQDALSP